jgi:hypothetical protein
LWSYCGSHVIVRRETTPKIGWKGNGGRVPVNEPGIPFRLNAENRDVTDLPFHRLKSFHHQQRKVMAYIVAILTATCLAVSAFVLHRTLPKQ